MPALHCTHFAHTASTAHMPTFAFELLPFPTTTTLCFLPASLPPTACLPFPLPACSINPFSHHATLQFLPAPAFAAPAFFCLAYTTTGTTSPACILIFLWTTYLPGLVLFNHPFGTPTFPFPGSRIPHLQGLPCLPGPFLPPCPPYPTT